LFDAQPAANNAITASDSVLFITGFMANPLGDCVECARHRSPCIGIVGAHYDSWIQRTPRDTAIQFGAELSAPVEKIPVAGADSVLAYRRARAPQSALSVVRGNTHIFIIQSERP
jgi:hypothetical protein